ncbi:hypothetical protein BH23ACT6_BH23ACT6_08650 [soil metagenome]
MDAAVVDVRLPPTLTDEGLQTAIGVACPPGFHVMVLSQFVDTLHPASCCPVVRDPWAIC